MLTESIKQKMAENSKRWHEVSREEQQKLERENQELSKKLDGASYDSDSGKWNVLTYDDEEKGATGIKEEKKIDNPFMPSFSGTGFLGGSVGKQVGTMQDYEKGNQLSFEQIMDVVNEKLKINERIESLTKQRQNEEIKKAQQKNDDVIKGAYEQAKMPNMTIVYGAVFGFLALAFLSLFKN